MWIQDGGYYKMQELELCSREQHTWVDRVLHRSVISIPREPDAVATAVASAVVAADVPEAATAKNVASAAVALENTVAVVVTALWVILLLLLRKLAATGGKNTAAAAAGSLCCYAYRDLHCHPDLCRYCVLHVLRLLSLTAPSLETSGQGMAARPIWLPLKPIRLGEGSLQFIQRKTISQGKPLRTEFNAGGKPVKICRNISSSVTSTR